MKLPFIAKSVYTFKCFALCAPTNHYLSLVFLWIKRDRNNMIEMNKFLEKNWGIAIIGLFFFQKTFPLKYIATWKYLKCKFKVHLMKLKVCVFWKL